jgi:hypothetical protein
MAEIESIVEPYGVLDDDRWKSVSFVDILSFHSAIVTELQLTCQYPMLRCTRPPKLIAIEPITINSIA